MQKKHLKSPQWISKPLNSCFNFHNEPEYALTQKIFAKEPIHSELACNLEVIIEMISSFLKKQDFCFGGKFKSVKNFELWGVLQNKSSAFTNSSMALGNYFCS